MVHNSFAVTAWTLRKADHDEDLVRSKNAADLPGKLDDTV
jgi:hypothetical protein